MKAKELAKEARKRGYKEGKIIRGFYPYPAQTYFRLLGEINEDGYFPFDNSFLMSIYGCIYLGGNWARIIDDPEEELKTLCKEMDWNYARSDDHSVYLFYHRKFHAIEELVGAVGTPEIKELYKKLKGKNAD